MTLRFAVLAMALGLSLAACAQSPDYSGQDADSVFTADIVPVLREQCESCHFDGGHMHREMPFEDAEGVGNLEDQLLSRRKGSGKAKVKAWQELRRSTP